MYRIGILKLNFFCDRIMARQKTVHNLNRKNYQPSPVSKKGISAHMYKQKEGD